MIFSSQHFLQKTNERILLYYYETSGLLVFVRFLEEIEDAKKTLRNYQTFTKFDITEKPTQTLVTITLVYRVYKFEFFIDTAEMFLRALGSNITHSLEFQTEFCPKT